MKRYVPSEDKGKSKCRSSTTFHFRVHARDTTDNRLWARICGCMFLLIQRWDELGVALHRRNKCSSHGDFQQIPEVQTNDTL